MEQVGHECVGFVEIDKYARKSYEAIYDTEGEWTRHDITTVTDAEWRELRGTVDVICGGFPCQSFSVAGKRGGFEDTRGTMFFEIARATKEIKPRYLLLENVKGLLSHGQGETFGIILNTLDELGYDVEWMVLNSKDFGVPQNRERVFIIGHLRGSSAGKVFPIGGTNSTTNDINIITHRKGYRRNTQVFDPNGITESLDTSQGGGRGHYTIKKVGNIRKNGTSQSGHVYDPDGISPTLCAADLQKDPLKIIRPVMTPDRGKKSQNGRTVKEDGEPMFTLTTKDIHGVMIKEATKKGFDIAEEGDSINLAVPGSNTRRGRVGKGVANTLDTSCNQGVLEPVIIDDTQNFDGVRTYNDYSPTLRSERGGLKVLERYRIRRLMPIECWRLQGFPDWAFRKAEEVNSNSQLYKQAGNAVTVNVIRVIAERLGEIENDE